MHAGPFPGDPRRVGVRPRLGEEVGLRVAVVGVEFRHASWGDRNIYGCLIMMNHGVIVAETKKMGPVDSSAQGEGIASSKCAEILENVREIARGMGILPDEPTVLRSDNLSNVRVSNDPKSAGRLRHALRRFATLQARVARGEIIVTHVPDEYNAADFLTK